MRRALLAAALATLTLLAPRCGGEQGRGEELVVSAAASLSEALPDYAEQSGYEARFSFAGSDELAAQIRQGATPDVYAAANTALPDDLHAAGLLKEPVVFATNRLVLGVPADSQRVDSLEDLAEPGVMIAIGDRDVPIGAYTHQVLGRLPRSESEGILGNVRSTEPDVLGIAAKLGQGAVDAGFLYGSDVSASNGRIERIELPARLEPDVAYGAGVVADAEHPGEAREFVEGLLSERGRAALRDNGLRPPP